MKRILFRVAYIHLVVPVIAGFILSPGIFVFVLFVPFVFPIFLEIQVALFVHSLIIFPVLLGPAVAAATCSFLVFCMVLRLLLNWHLNIALSTIVFCVIFGGVGNIVVRQWQLDEAVRLGARCVSLKPFWARLNGTNYWDAAPSSTHGYAEIGGRTLMWSFKNGSFVDEVDHHRPTHCAPL